MLLQPQAFPSLPLQLHFLLYLLLKLLLHFLPAGFPKQQALAQARVQPAAAHPANQSRRVL